MTLTHMLCFEDNGHTQSIIMEIGDVDEDEEVNKQIAGEIEKQFKKLSLQKKE